MEELGLRDRFLRLKGNSFRADVVFNLQPEGVEIPAHKLILSLASPRFSREFAEENSTYTERNVYHIEGTEARIFDAFLTFIYTMNVDLCPEIAFGLMKLAKMYEMEQLCGWCSNYVLKTLTECNIWTYFAHSVDVFEDECLRAKCLDYISHSDGGIYHRDDFFRLSRGGVKLLLEMESIRVTESELLEVIIKWIDFHRGTTERRKALGDLLHLIHFPAMSSTEFNEFLEDYPDLLHHQEIHEIKLAISGAPNTSAFAKASRTRLPRMLFGGENSLMIVSQFPTIYGGSEKPKDLRITFKVLGSEDSFVSGIGILVDHHFDQAIHGQISVQINTDSGWKDDAFPAIEGGHQMKHGKRHKLLFLVFQEMLKVVSSRWMRINLTTKCKEVVKVEGEFCETAYMGKVQVKFIRNDKHSSIPLILFR